MPKTVNRSDMGNFTPAERLRQIRAAQAIQRGEIKIPIRCGFCRSESMTPDIQPGSTKDDHGKPANLECLSCGRRTSIVTARRLRRQEIAARIREGVDLVKT